MEQKHLFAAIALPLIASSTLLPAAWGSNNNQNEQPSHSEKCTPAPAAPCNKDECCRTYCMGPTNVGINAPVRPRTCNGDIVLSVSGFYWNAHQDGMEFAIDDGVTTPNATDSNRRELIDAKFVGLKSDWDFGFKVGVGYNSACDGWDFGVTWTRYKGKASNHVEAETDDNRTLLPIWTAAAVQNDEVPVYATDIEACWKLDLNLIDLELGREAWIGRRLSMRPHVGLRVSYISQDFELLHKGGSFSNFTIGTESAARNDEVEIENDFKGVGIRGGFDTNWHLGCGFSIYGDLAFSLVYGRFSFDYDEDLRLAVTPFDKLPVAEIEDHFRATRLMVDLGLGLEYSALFCDCKYGFSAKFGWEQHLFLGQNQMWRITRADTQEGNIFHQRRGDLDTQGWTLTFTFDY